MMVDAACRWVPFGNSCRSGHELGLPGVADGEEGKVT